MEECNSEKRKEETLDHLHCTGMRLCPWNIKLDMRREQQGLFSEDRRDKQ